MKYRNPLLAHVSLFGLSLSLALTTGCNNPLGMNSSSGSSKKKSNSQTAAIKQVSAQDQCQQPEISAKSQGTEVHIGELLMDRVGRFQLDTVDVFQRVTTQDGKYVAGFHGRAVRSSSAKVLGETKASLVCAKTVTQNKQKFFSAANFTIAPVLHAPSGRITLFDEKTSGDDPNFNLSVLGHLSFNTWGTASYQAAFATPDLAKGKNLYLTDILATKSKDAPKIYALTNGSFEIRFNRVQTTTLRKIQLTTTTSAVITYKSAPVTTAAAQ